MTATTNRSPAGWKSRLLAPFQSKLRNKLLIFMLLLSLLPITAVSYMAIARSASSMEREIIDFNQSQLSTVSAYMSEKLSQLDELLSSVIIDDQISDRMGRLDNDDITQFYRANDYITNKLTSLFYANQSVLNDVMLYVGNIDKTYIVNPNEESLKSASLLSSVVWNSFDLEHSRSNYASDGDKNSFLLMRSINRFEDRKQLGMAALDVKWSVMDRMLRTLLEDDGADVYLVDDSGRPLYSPNGAETRPLLVNDIMKKLAANDAAYEKIGDDYVFASKVPYAFFSVVKIMPNVKVVQSSNDIIRSSLGIAAVVVCICVALSVLFAYMVTKPITNLVRYMRKLDWIRTDYVADRSRQDEIGLLESSFQTMVGNIKGLIQFEYEATIAKRTAEVKALQAQINPHFLQNTLQLISGMAIEKGVPEIHSVVKAIGGMFRYSIRGLPDMTTLREEWQHMRNYLYIQETRFPSMLTADATLPEAFERLPIPLLTLQPLVENAFEHGFQNKLSDWRITIGVLCDDEGGTIIRIADNGRGISAGRLDELRRSLDSGSPLYQPSESIGLRNVDARIKLHFGKTYGLRIASTEGKGTVISIHLPAPVSPDEPNERERGSGNDRRNEQRGSERS